MEENNFGLGTMNQNNPKNNTQMIAGAILLAAVIIGGAIMLRGTSAPAGTANPPTPTGGTGTPNTGTVPPVTAADRTIGNPSAKVVVIEYADFQCPFCERFFMDAGKAIMDDYVNTGKVLFVYRDFAFLGQESIKSAEAAYCAGDQGKFWEYHDYLFNHQSGENQGAFADAKLKSFATNLGLNTSTFNTCLDSGKHNKEVLDSRTSGAAAGVNGTPKGFILKNGKVVATIDGAEPSASVIPKIDAALK